MSSISRVHIFARVVTGVLGSWVFVFGFVSISVLLLARLGMSYSDAQTLMYLLGVVVLLAAFLWSFGADRLGRVWALLGGGGLIMLGAAWWLARAAT